MSLKVETLSQARLPPKLMTKHQNKIHKNQIPTNNSNKNFASVTAHEYTPSLDTVSQNEYILAIGQIII